MHWLPLRHSFCHSPLLLWHTCSSARTAAASGSVASLSVMAAAVISLHGRLRHIHCHICAHCRVCNAL